MIAIELVKPGTQEPDADMTSTLNKACYAAGLLTLTAGTWSNVFRFLPPLVINTPTLNQGLDILESAFTQLLTA
jgi:4-aminobutyrate aminotransferase/(S)-3-amino-2-methylpropionate transaminase